MRAEVQSRVNMLSDSARDVFGKKYVVKNKTDQDRRERASQAVRQEPKGCMKSAQ